MQLPRLDIHSTFSQIGMKQERASLYIRQPRADLKMNQPQPEVKLHKTKGELEIDQTEAFADANLKNPLRVVKEWAQKTKQKLLQNLAKEAVEGERLMNIEQQKGTIIPEIAKQNSEPTQKQLSIGYMPSSAEKVKFYYKPSQIDVSVNQENLQIDIKPNQPVINYKAGDIQIYLRQKASINFKAVGITLDQKI